MAPSKSPPRDRLITDAQAAALLSVSPTWVRRRRRNGTFTTVRVGKLARLRESEVLAYINRGGEE